jgi:hypothetical protein
MANGHIANIAIINPNIAQTSAPKDTPKSLADSLMDSDNVSKPSVLSAREESNQNPDQSLKQAAQHFLEFMSRRTQISHHRSFCFTELIFLAQ